MVNKNKKFSEDIESVKQILSIKHEKFGIESEKYLRQTRIYVALMLLLLSKGQKDTLIAINNLKDDISLEHDILGTRIRKFFVDIKGLNVLLIIINDKRVSTKFTSKGVDIL